MGKKLGILAAIFGIILAVGIIVWKIPKPKNEPQEFPSEYTEEETIKYKVPESPVSHVMEAEGKERDTLYSDTTICSTFAEDIRDMCIEVFGDYLRPLQEPYELITEAGYEYFVAYGSDTETCVKVPGESLEFNVYLRALEVEWLSKRVETLTARLSEYWKTVSMKPLRLLKRETLRR